MNVTDFYTASLLESAEVKQRTIEACRDETLRAIEAIVAAYRAGRKVLFCGNGGSAADSQHLACELLIRLSHDVERPALAALSLCTDPSVMTGGGNDIGYENIFARAIEGLGNAGDILVGISTSGRSRNVVLAVEKARQKGMTSICLLGGSGGALRDLALPVSYLGTGQSVPEDLQRATASTLAAWATGDGAQIGALAS